MNKNAISILVISVASISIWSLLFYFGVIDPKTVTILTIFSLGLLIYSAYDLLIFEKFTNSYFRFIFFTFMVYSCITVLRGISFSYNDIKSYIQSGHLFWPFIIPLFVFFDKRISTIALLIKWIYIIGLFFLVLSLLFPTLLIHRQTAETTISIGISCGFLLLNATYLSSKKANISFMIIIISLLSVVYLSRRNVIVTLIGFILSSYFLNIKNTSRSVLFRFLPLIIGFALLLFWILPNLSSKLTSRIEERLTEDTRTGLYEMFLWGMQNDMVFGKGMNGTYYFPIGGEIEEEGITFAEAEYRSLIENGYFQLLLSGGFIHIFLFLLTTLPAVILGIFKSSNQLAKASGVVVFLWLVDMLIYGLPRLSFHYILFWISVGICYSANLRKTTDEEIRNEFQKIGLI